MGAASPVFQQPGLCPCGHPECDVIGTKLTKYGCLVGCNEPSCRGRRNRRKGKLGEKHRHQRLGRGGATPHDELGWVYSVEVVTQDKKGAQVPAKFTSFVASKWFKDALRQAEKIVPEGVQCFPAVYLEPAGGGAWLVVRVTPEIRKVAR